MKDFCCFSYLIWELFLHLQCSIDSIQMRILQNHLESCYNIWPAEPHFMKVRLCIYCTTTLFSFLFRSVYVLCTPLQKSPSGFLSLYLSQTRSYSISFLKGLLQAKKLFQRSNNISTFNPKIDFYKNSFPLFPNLGYYCLINEKFIESRFPLT